MRHLLFGLAALLLAAGMLAWFGGAVQSPAETDYQRMASWGEDGDGPGQLNEPTGIAVNAEGIFVADARNHRIQVFDRQGRFLRQFGNEQLGRPMNMKLAGGELFVADYFADRIQVFSPDGRFQRSLAPADGLNSPGGVDVFEDGSLLVADTYAQRVVRFKPDGTVLASWGGDKGWRRGQFKYPTDVAVLADGGFIVADGYNDRLQRFDAAGEFVGAWGGLLATGIAGSLPGWLKVASSVAVNSDGDIAIADFFNGRFQVATPNGTLLATGESQPPRSVFAIAWGSDGSIWATDHAANRVVHYRQSVGK